MSEKTGSIVFFGLTIMAFCYGYGGQQLYPRLQALFLKKEGPQLSEKAQTTTNLPSSGELNPKEINLSKTNSLNQVVARPSLPLVKNPSALGTTLDSIQPGQVQEEQREQRNLYFEKLSGQMKQLQAQQAVNGSISSSPTSPPALGGIPSSDVHNQNRLPFAEENDIAEEEEDEEDTEESIEEEDSESGIDEGLEEEEPDQLDALTAHDQAELDQTIQQVE